MSDEPDKDKTLGASITLIKACEIISAETGQKATPETHWVTASIELTRDAPPYALVRLTAHKR